MGVAPKTCRDCPLGFIGGAASKTVQCSAQHVSVTYRPGPDCPYVIIDGLLKDCPEKKEVEDE